MSRLRKCILLPAILGIALGFTALQMGAGAASADYGPAPATVQSGYPVTGCGYGYYRTAYRCPSPYFGGFPAYWSYYRWPAFYGHSPMFSNGYWWWWNGSNWWWSLGSGHQWYPGH
jgi:hypothetical protein